MNNEKISEILTAAKAVIQDPVNWIRNDFAWDMHGNSLDDGTAHDAVCFCSLGALQKITQHQSGDSTDVPYYQAVDYLYQAVGGNVVEFNDIHTHEEVMNAWDKAIALAEEDERIK